MHTHLNGVPPRVLSSQQLVSLTVQLIDSLLFGLQVPVDEILHCGAGGFSAQPGSLVVPSDPCPPPPGPSTHLVLTPAAGVVEVAVTPVVLHAALGLLVQPVQLVGAALHVVLQGAQVLLPRLRRRLQGGDRAETSLHTCSSRLWPGRTPVGKLLTL